MLHAPHRSRPAHRTTRHYRRALSLLFEELEPRTLFSISDPASLLAQANNAFAFDLYQQLRTTNPGNLFFSPYSIATALEMTLQGARGTTAAEMIQALHLPAHDVTQAGIQALYQLLQADPATAGFTLSTANRLWVKDNFPLLQSFLDDTQNLFGAGAEPIDFSNPDAAAATINAWVSDQTHGKIPNLIPATALNNLTRLVLTNAIYFKGDWASPFNAYGTHDADFHVSADQVMTVNMMQQLYHVGYYAQSGPDGFQAVDLPYKGNDLDMLIILPTSSSLTGFESSFTPDLFTQITSNLSSRDVFVQLPKFTLNEAYDLVQPLQDLGIGPVFDRKAADLTGIAQLPSNQRLYVTDVIHKSFIQVDEKGTEAAAATAVIIGVTATCWTPPPPPPIPFTADHPFLFAIRERSTNTILFLGDITDPGYDPNGNSPPPASRGGGGGLLLGPGGPLQIGPILHLPITLPAPTPPGNPTDPIPPTVTPNDPLAVTTAPAATLPPTTPASTPFPSLTPAPLLAPLAPLQHPTLGITSLPTLSPLASSTPTLAAPPPLHEPSLTPPSTPATFTLTSNIAPTLDSSLQIDLAST